MVERTQKYDLAWSGTSLLGYFKSTDEHIAGHAAGAILSVDNLLPVGRDDQEVTIFCDRRMCQVEITVFV